MDDAKAFMRVDHSDDDELIEAFIQAAQDHVEGRNGILQRAIRLQTWDYTFAKFPGPGCNQTIEIPLPPLIDVISVSYTDAAGDIQTFESGDFEVDTNSVPGRVRLVNGGIWPTANEDMYEAVRVRFLAGYIEADYPTPIKLAIKIMVADMYENRESVTGQNVNRVNIPMAVTALLDQYVIHAFA